MTKPTALDSFYEGLSQTGSVTMDPKYRINDPTNTPTGSYWDPTTQSMVQGPAHGTASGDGNFTWNGYTNQWVPTQQYMDLQQNGDPSLGTNVNYGNGVVENFAQGQNPTLFLSAGSNYADTGGMKAAVPGTPLYDQLTADANTRAQQGIAKIAALVGGGALAANSAWSLGGSGTNTGTSIASASDAAAGFVAPTSGGFGGVAGSGAASIGTEAAGYAAGAGAGGAGIPFASGFGVAGDTGAAAGTTAGSTLSTAGATAGGASGVTSLSGDAAGTAGDPYAGLSLLGDAANSGSGNWLSSLLSGESGNLIRSLLTGAIGLNASNEASNAVTDANDKSLAFLRENRDLAIGMNKPFYDASVGALDKLQGLAGLKSGVDVNSLVTADPSYQFRQQQQMQALESSAAAKGGLLSGSFGKDVLDLSGKYASQEYSNIYNRVAQIAGYGQPAVNSTTTANTNATNMYSNIMQDQGASNASGYLGKGSVLLNLASQLGNIDWSKIGKGG